METVSNLNTFCQILSEKGYDGYFQTNGGFGGKLKDSITDYLESLPKGQDSSEQNKLLVTGFLEWKGDDKPYIECHMSIKHLNGKFFFNTMEIIRRDHDGQTIRRIEVKDLTIMIVPDARDAIAMVDNNSALRILLMSRGSDIENEK